MKTYRMVFVCLASVPFLAWAQDPENNGDQSEQTKRCTSLTEKSKTEDGLSFQEGTDFWNCFSKQDQKDDGFDGFQAYQPNDDWLSERFKYYDFETVPWTGEGRV